MFDLSGRVALVTGAGRSVGEGIARALAARGAAVLVNDIDAGRAERVASEIRAGGDRAEPLSFDVTDRGAVDEAVARASRSHGPVGILVNNAGVPEGMQVRLFLDMLPEEWRPFIDLNLYGSMHCVRATAPAMREAGWGRIVQISSGAGTVGVAFGVAVYGASKSGIEGLIRHLAMEFASDGVTANVVALGAMNNISGEIAEQLAVRVPLGRLGTPEDVGAAVVYLASEEASWITGQTLHLSGGAVNA